MFHSLGHHVGWYWMLLDDTEWSLISIKHRLQHHPAFLSFLGVNNNGECVWPWYSTFLLHLPKPRNNYLKHSFSYSSALLWMCTSPLKWCRGIHDNDLFPSCLGSKNQQKSERAKSLNDERAGHFWSNQVIDFISAVQYMSSIYDPFHFIVDSFLTGTLEPRNEVSAQ